MKGKHDQISLIQVTPSKSILWRPTGISTGVRSEKRKYLGNNEFRFFAVAP
jgi:hypothetical protein